ncbi:hypothetical protein GGP78_003345 [Salinibacter ruber]|nr:hypothetical protein [Salinibacter ruber]
MRRTLSGFAHGWSTEIEIKTASKKLVRRASIAAKGVETVDGKHIEATTDGLVNLHRRVKNQFA